MGSRGLGRFRQPLQPPLRALSSSLTPDHFSAAPAPPVLAPVLAQPWLLLLWVSAPTRLLREAPSALPSRPPSISLPHRPADVVRHLSHSAKIFKMYLFLVYEPHLLSGRSRTGTLLSDALWQPQDMAQGLAHNRSSSLVNICLQE